MKTLQNISAHGSARACAHICKRIDGIIHGTDESRAIPLPVPWYLQKLDFWILFQVLFVGMLSHSCTGARANVHPQFANVYSQFRHQSNAAQYDINVYPHAAILPFLPLTTLQLGPTALHPPHHSVLTAIQNGAHQRGARVSRTGPGRRLRQRPTWADRRVGCL